MVFITKKDLPALVHPSMLSAFPARPDLPAGLFSRYDPPAAMLETIRKHHYILMLIIAILVCVAFVFFGSDHRGGDQGDGKPMAIVDGQEYYQNDVQQIDSQRSLITRLFYDQANMMSQITDPLAFYLNTLGGSPMMRSPAIVQLYGPSGERDSLNMDFCMNVATLRAKAPKLGIEVDQDDLVKFVQTVSGFQTNGQFDSTKYEAFLNSGAFGDRSNTERRLFTALRDVMIFQRVNKLIGGTLAPSAAEVNARYTESHQKTTASYVLIEKAKQTPAAPAEDAIQKFYDEAKAAFDAHTADPMKPAASPLVLSPEKRSIRYVLIDLPKPPTPPAAPQPEDVSKLPEDQKKAKEEENKKKAEEHTKAMTAHAEAVKTQEAASKTLLEKAGAISSDLASEDRGTRPFEEIVKASGLEPKTSELFTADAAPADLKAEAKLIGEIFDSPKDPGIAHTLKTTNGYAIFEIASVESPTVLPLDQVKVKVTEHLTAEATTAAVKTAADTARTAIQEALKGGKSFAEAATAAGLTPMEVPAWSQSKPPTAPNQAIITKAAADLNPGEISPPEEVPEGLMLVSTLKRELPKDPKMEEDKKKLAEEAAEGKEPSTGGGFNFPSFSPLLQAWFKANRTEVKAEATSG